MTKGGTVLNGLKSLRHTLRLNWVTYLSQAKIVEQKATVSNMIHYNTTLNSFPECLEPASRVISRWKNGNYYKGEIDSITNRVNVLFDNGARLAYNPRDSVDIVVDRIPDHNELPWGSQILVNRPRSRAFEIGYIRDINNGRFVILYENGDEILHTLDQLRAFNKSRVCGECKFVCNENSMIQLLINHNR